MDMGPLDDDELEIETDEHGYPLLIEPLDEPLHDGGLWERLVSCRPGLATLAAVLTADWDALSSDEALDALLVLERSGSWLDAARQEGLAAVSRGNATRDRWSTESVSVLLGIAPQTAQTKLKNAQQLVDRLPAAHRALRAGELSVLKAQAITEASYPLPDDTLPAYQQRCSSAPPGKPCGS